MSKITFTTAYNRTPSSIKDVNCQKFDEPSKVKQSLSYAVDINTIYENYCNTGKLPLNGQQPLYDENFVKVDDLVSAMKLCDEASQYFVGLPSEIKKHYGNSLVKFIKALNSKDDFLVSNGVLNIPSSEVSTEPIKNNLSVDNGVSNTSDNSSATPDVNTVTTD